MKLQVCIFNSSSAKEVSLDGDKNFMQSESPLGLTSYPRQDFCVANRNVSFLSSDVQRRD